MDNELIIKKSFLYNSDLHNKINKAKIIKEFVIVLISLLIIILSVIICIEIIKNELSNNYFFILYIFCMILALVFLFVLFYNLVSLGFTMVTEKVLFNYTGFVITSDNQFIKFKFNPDLEYYRYDLLKQSKLDEMLKLLILKKSIKRNKRENIEQVQEGNININDIYECLSIVNVYNVIEKKDCIEVKCDYVDLLNNTNLKNQIIVVYKYYDNWNEMLNYLNDMKNSEKQQNNYKDGEHRKFVEFVLISIQNKWNHVFLYIFPFLMILHDMTENSGGIYAICEIFITILIIIYLLEKETLKYLNSDEVEEKAMLLHKLKLDKIFILIYFILYIIFSLFESKKLNVAIMEVVFVGIFVFLVVRKIKK